VVPISDAYYFAYGSNMSLARMQARIAGAVSLGPGVVRGWRFACNTLGFDGSAKANVLPAIHPKALPPADSSSQVWGVVYRLPRVALHQLDRLEGGYRRWLVGVRTARGALRCHIYWSERLTEQLRPYDWYRDHMLTGALEHRLPEAWISMLRQLASTPAERP
jgi:hypothetical protein